MYPTLCQTQTFTIRCERMFQLYVPQHKNGTTGNRSKATDPLKIIVVPFEQHLSSFSISAYIYQASYINLVTPKLRRCFIWYKNTKVVPNVRVFLSCLHYIFSQRCRSSSQKRRRSHLMLHWLHNDRWKGECDRGTRSMSGVFHGGAKIRGAVGIERRSSRHNCGRIQCQ